MPSSKKDRKHAKETGGIAAAVTKQTAGKFSALNANANGSAAGSNGSKSPAASTSSATSSPPADTPEIKPAVALDNVNPTVSPILEPLSTTPVSASTAPSMNNDWMRNGLAGSPGNLILMGESPPTQPSSYEDPSRLHHGWAAQRPYMSPSPASFSPPNNFRRPLSFHMEAQYQSPETPPHLTTSYRRGSVNSPFPGSRIASHPPLPHQPQSHFYGAPDVDLNMTSNSGIKAGERGYFFGFDKLPECSGFPGGPGNVVIAGYEGGLDVYAVGKRGLEPVGSLKGLRGGVHHAKILPWTVDGDKESLFPLVAVVLHGPVLASTPGISVNNDTASPKLDGTTSPRSVFTQQEGFQGRQTSPIDSYQTSVEIYSLKTNQQVDVLLQAPKIPINPEISVTNPIFRPPQPSGAFTIRADSGTLVVCSGLTGECWVYLQLLESQNGHIFTCVGKLWASLQQSYRGDVPEEAEKARDSPAPPRPITQTPILTLNGRWIAYCPPAPSSQISLRAHVPLPILGKAPGLSSITPPQLPSISASVDLPISDSVVNKIMRETTQELIQGAKWVGQQGLQAWNSYWNKSSGPQSLPQQARSPPQHWAGTRSPHADPSQFPPTHGSSGQAVTKEPGLVSIVDAESLTSSSSIHPLATFVTPLGCSFLSFSPSSLALFTASSKGDVQTVWDLLRIQHTRSSPLQATVAPNTNTGPQVRQIAQFSRMTVARIVDVAWTEASGERIAMVTERGTVHLLDMPSSAFIWPAPRRRKAVLESGTATPEPSGSAASIASGAFGAAYHAAKPYVTRPRRSSANMPGVTGSTLKDSAAIGGRVIAASISSSLGKTGMALNQLRHTGENRVSLPPSSTLPSASCVAWIKSRRHHALFVVGDGLVRTFSCKTRRSSVQSGRRVTRASRYQDYNVPALPNDLVAPAVRQMMDLGAQEEILDLSDRDMDAGNTLTLNARPRIAPAEQAMESSIPQAEIESSAPYQPFHTDRRVTLCEYSRGTATQLELVSQILADTSLEESTRSKKKKKGQPAGIAASHETPSSGNWAFGQDIAVVRLDLGLPPVPEEDNGGPDDHIALPQSAMERVMQYGDEEQIVVTTRRRRGAQGNNPGEDGFFEDDCEVLDFADQRV
ncbi:hypothetical protein EDB81DRAFT_775030 [Dactylonectria macrodidyma]|uniref:Uncharacterized protein n=1 Tax=Dactylonectria macrodidyma TaxID=307937 RepID=A0A9P9FQ35_9HYPO|nr:hypothetical protein EDB81DRAFT_775030 [Dactylonectria macrodidyma]